MQCKYCDTAFKHEIYGKYSVRCPHCYRLLEHLSDYGFGPVTPFYICIGNEVIGVVEVQSNSYYLQFQGQQISLQETYFNAVKEAEEYVVDRLNLAKKEVPNNIITKMGSLWFYGESFGRPFDNIHKVKSISYDGELLIINFNEHEELFVYNPSDITSTEKELKISHASKVKWSYTPYGSHTGRKTITYTHNGSAIIKSIGSDKNIVAGDCDSAAVLLAGY